MRKLVLMYPNQRWQKLDTNTVWNLNPYSLCLLATMVREDVEVKIIDAQFYNLSVEEFTQEIETYKPDYVGISVMTSEYSQILDVAAGIVKGVDSNIKVIAGGVHVTMEYQEVMGNRDIDFVIRGEGEYVLRDLIRFLNHNGQFPSQGVVFREGETIQIQEQAFVTDLAQLPWPDYSLVKFEDYTHHGPRQGPLRPPEYPYIRMSTTRGCPFGCSFCQVESLSGRTVRTRDPLDVVNEILFLKEKYGIQSVIFDDDNIVARKEFFVKFLNLYIEKEVNLSFIIGAFAIFLLDDETLDLLARAGCVGVNIAIESGNKRVLKEIIGKPIDLEKTTELIAAIKRKGLYCLANFIIGFPGETWEEIRETIHYAEFCGAEYVKFFVAVPLKGTRLYQKVIELASATQIQKIVVDWRYSQISSDEWTAQDVSILRAYEWDRVNFSKPERKKRVAEIWGISEQEMSKIQKQTRDALIFDQKVK